MISFSGAIFLPNEGGFIDKTSTSWTVFKATGSFRYFHNFGTRCILYFRIHNWAWFKIYPVCECFLDLTVVISFASAVLQEAEAKFAGSLGLARKDLRDGI